MFIYYIEQRQFPKCISPVGARASSDTVPVPVVLSPQHAKTLGFHLSSRSESSTCETLGFHLYLKLKIFLSTTELLFDTPYFRSEITLDLHGIILVSLVPLPAQQCLLSLLHVWTKDLESFCLSILASVSGRSHSSSREIFFVLLVVLSSCTKTIIVSAKRLS